MNPSGEVEGILAITSDMDDHKPYDEKDRSAEFNPDTNYEVFVPITDEIIRNAQIAGSGPVTRPRYSGHFGAAGNFAASFSDASGLSKLYTSSTAIPISSWSGVSVVHQVTHAS
jgi:hypothetical protein